MIYFIEFEMSFHVSDKKSYLGIIHFRLILRELVGNRSFTVLNVYRVLIFYLNVEILPLKCENIITISVFSATDGLPPGYFHGSSGFITFT